MSSSSVESLSTAAVAMTKLLSQQQKQLVQRQKMRPGLVRRQQGRRRNLVSLSIAEDDDDVESIKVDDNEYEERESKRSNDSYDSNERESLSALKASSQLQQQQRQWNSESMIQPPHRGLHESGLGERSKSEGILNVDDNNDDNSSSKNNEDLLLPERPSRRQRQGKQEHRQGARLQGSACQKMKAREDKCGNNAGSKIRHKKEGIHHQRSRQSQYRRSNSENSLEVNGDDKVKTKNEMVIVKGKDEMNAMDHQDSRKIRSLNRSKSESSILSNYSPSSDQERDIHNSAKDDLSTDDYKQTEYRKQKQQSQHYMQRSRKSLSHLPEKRHSRKTSHKESTARHRHSGNNSNCNSRGNTSRDDVDEVGNDTFKKSKDLPTQRKRRSLTSQNRRNADDEKHAHTHHGRRRSMQTAPSENNRKIISDTANLKNNESTWDDAHADRKEDTKKDHDESKTNKKLPPSASRWNEKDERNNNFQDGEEDQRQNPLYNNKNDNSNNDKFPNSMSSRVTSSSCNIEKRKSPRRDDEQAGRVQPTKGSTENEKRTKSAEDQEIKTHESEIVVNSEMMAPTDDTNNLRLSPTNGAAVKKRNGLEKRTLTKKKSTTTTTTSTTPNTATRRKHNNCNREVSEKAVQIKTIVCNHEDTIDDDSGLDNNDSLHHPYDADKSSLFKNASRRMRRKKSGSLLLLSLRHRPLPSSGAATAAAIAGRVDVDSDSNGSNGDSKPISTQQHHNDCLDPTEEETESYGEYDNHYYGSSNVHDNNLEIGSDNCMASEIDNHDEDASKTDKSVSLPLRVPSGSKARSTDDNNDNNTADNRKNSHHQSKHYSQELKKLFRVFSMKKRSRSKPKNCHNDDIASGVSSTTTATVAAHSFNRKQLLLEKTISMKPIKRYEAFSDDNHSGISDF